MKPDVLPPRGSRPSPLCTFASSVLLLYLCGIGVYLWSSNLACRMRDLGEPSPLVISTPSWDVEQRGRFVVVKNYVRSGLVEGKSVTFAAAALFDELADAPEVCNRWKGPMSIAVYAPGSDFRTAIRKVLNMRLINSCIHQNATWHFYFDSEFAPPHLRSPEEEAGLQSASPNSPGGSWPLGGSFRGHGSLPFPANVGRNVAVAQSRTDLVLVADLNHYPSADILPRFMQLLKYEVPTRATGRSKAYVLPVFSTTGYGSKLPSAKSELVRQAADGSIVLPIGGFPSIGKWMEARTHEEALSVHYVSQDKEEFESWQPYYIATKDIPAFHEEQVKEGKNDRKTHLLELCLKHYEFHILDNAFLVQVQQIASTTKDVNVLQKFILHNNEAREKKTEDLLCRYGSDTGCLL